MNVAPHSSSASSQDRLTTALFIAAAAHAVLLLGIGFTSPRRPAGEISSMEVVLVHDPDSDSGPNAHPDYLANVNQHGAGTSTDVRHAEAPGGDPVTGAEGHASGGGDHEAGASDDDIVSTRTQRTASRATLAIASGARSPIVVETARSDASSVDSGDTFALRGHPAKELVVTANTRESSVAVYLDAWRHRIERVGTANYPLDSVRRSHLTGNPVLEVRVASDGHLVDAVVSRSSGHVELDQAALNILRLSAPFEPFPAALAAEHDSVRLTYEWQFSDGQWTDSAVRVPANTR
jgi:protein TonB